MKTKGGSLYEVLKSASRPGGADDGAHAGAEPPAAPTPEGAQPTLQERLAAYKAAKLAAATQPAPAPEPPKASSATLILEPDPTPIPAPTVTRVGPPLPTLPAASIPEPAPAVEASKGPGERVIRLTYNTALFGGMVAVGLLFVAYAIGLHVGKGNAAAEFQASSDVVRAAPRPYVPAPMPPPPPPPPAPRKEYTIRLGEWKQATAQDRLKALSLSEDQELRKSLERMGFRGLEKQAIRRGNEDRLALYIGRYADLNSDAAKSALTALKTFKWKRETPFAQAAFEEVAPK